MTTDLPTPARALAICAHPDDIEFGCGGTLAKWARDGCAIFHAVCTDGSKGTWDEHQDPDELVAIRKDEQRAAAKILGGTGDVIFFGWVDGELESGHTERHAIARAIRQVAPDVVLGHDPWKRYRLHPDHRHAGFLVTDGVVAARDPLFYPDLDVAPHRPHTVLLWEADEPDHVERIDSTIAVKFEALMAHRSQLRSTMGIPDGASDDDPATKAFHDAVRTRAAEAGSSEGVQAGEAFKRIEG